MSELPTPKESAPEESAPEPSAPGPSMSELSARTSGPVVSHSATLTPMAAAEVETVAAAYSFGVVPHEAPPWMQPHRHGFAFTLPRSLPDCWRWLNDPATFVDGQIWPYRVEFVSPDPAVPPGFHVGVLNTHHGPGLNFAGVMTAVEPMAYRDLRYFYGSYAISPRLIRPTRLQFWTEAVAGDLAGPDQTAVRLQIDSFVHRRWAGRWSWLQDRFWKRFPKWMQSGIDAAG